MKLEDLIDRDVLQNLQDLFSDATGLAAIAVDADGNYVTKPSNFTDFCMKYTRGSEVGSKRCAKCDNENKGTYYCHAGLMDFAEEIVVDGIKLGAILGGQVLPAPPDEEKFKKFAKEYGVEEKEFLEVLHKVPIKTEKSIRASAALLGQVINNMANMKYYQNKEQSKENVLGNEMVQAIDATERISQKAKDLTAIAKKQNILSLNASIEAARSGDAGAGFSIVAKQMGELTQNSATLYDEISDDAKKAYDAVSKVNEALK